MTESGWMRWTVGLLLTLYGIIMGFLMRTVSLKVDKSDCERKQDTCPVKVKMDLFAETTNGHFEDLKGWMEKINDKLEKHLEKHGS